ncbi:hypothetical protein [Streptomyces sp. SAS_270]|uniref:hypothetical protein n=1 Tax=Streptomyces sp. SAS_270 TaxID=3412748 RepID=UPI00403D41A3
MSVNELTGTMSWRTIQPGGSRSGARRDRTAAPHSSAADRRGKAAALRAAGLDPARVASRGAAPIPAHPAAVRAAVGVSVETLTPGQLQHHLALVGALRSRVAGDAARGTRMPSTVAARLRSESTPGRVQALTVERASAVRELGARSQAPGPRR